MYFRSSDLGFCLLKLMWLFFLSVPSQEVLQNLYRTKSFLFLGCGETLRDQIFQALFLYTVKNKVDLEHYMLVLKENEDHFFKLQADMLLHGIKVVSYGDCFQQFPEYVQDLTAQICKQRSPGNVASSTAQSAAGTGQFALPDHCSSSKALTSCEGHAELEHVFFFEICGFWSLWIVANLILNSGFVSLLVFGKGIYLTCIYDVNYLSLLSITL